jgi:2-methylisocitrate lyase-like PEP mutase family enzyme
MDMDFRNQLKQELAGQAILPFIGVYDVFSASIAANHFNGIFLSGFGFAASYYGLPDIGFIAWSDMVSYVQRVRTVLPRHFLLVDMDDGYGDPDIASHVTRLIESAGASGIVIEDQRRPRRCGHFDGKQLLDIDEFLHKLTRVLGTRRKMFVVARTDAVDPDEIFLRAKAYANAGADAVLVDGVGDLSLISQLKQYVNLPIVFNQIAGGKFPLFSLEELKNAGISIVIYSTPCLFPAQAAVEKAMISLKENQGLIKAVDTGGIDLKMCTDHLRENHSRSKESE